MMIYCRDDEMVNEGYWVPAKTVLHEMSGEVCATEGTEMEAELAQLDFVRKQRDKAFCDMIRAGEDAQKAKALNDILHRSVDGLCDANAKLEAEKVQLRNDLEVASTRARSLERRNDDLVLLSNKRGSDNTLLREQVDVANEAWRIRGDRIDELEARLIDAQETISRYANAIADGESRELELATRLSLLDRGLTHLEVAVHGSRLDLERTRRIITTPTTQEQRDEITRLRAELEGAQLT